MARLGGPHVIEDHARDFEHVLIILDFLGMLEEGAHHPQVSKHGDESLHGFFRGHVFSPEGVAAIANKSRLAASIRRSTSTKSTTCVLSFNGGSNSTFNLLSLSSTKIVN